MSLVHDMSTALTAPYSAVPILQFLQRRSKLCILFEEWVKVICIYCEAQGKGREGQRVDVGRSLKGHL